MRPKNTGPNDNVNSNEMGQYHNVSMANVGHLGGHQRDKFLDPSTIRRVDLSCGLVQCQHHPHWPNEMGAGSIVARDVGEEEKEIERNNRRGERGDRDMDGSYVEKKKKKCVENNSKNTARGRTMAMWKYEVVMRTAQENEDTSGSKRRKAKEKGRSEGWKVQQ